MKYHEFPKPEQIKTFNELFDAGWSITYAMSKARITGVQYVNFLNNCPLTREKVELYKKTKKRYNKAYFGGTPLTVSQHLELGIAYKTRDADAEALRKLRDIEKTRLNIECLQNGTQLLPRGK